MSHFNSGSSFSTNRNPRKFKLLLVGNGGAGKTALIDRYITGEFRDKYCAVDVRSIVIHTTIGDVEFEVWDVSGSTLFVNHHLITECYYQNADCAIIMFSLDHRINYRNIASWYRSITVESSFTRERHIPIVVCGNMSDLSEKDRKIPSSSINFPSRHNLPYVEISVKEEINCELPFIYLIRQLFPENNPEDINVVDYWGNAPSPPCVPLGTLPLPEEAEFYIDTDENN